MSARQLALAWWMLINGTLTKLCPALFIPNGCWETDKSSLACRLISYSQASRFAFRLFVYLLQREYYVRVSSPGWWFFLWEQDKFSSLGPSDLTVLPAVDGTKRPWVVRTDKQMSNQVSMKGCNHTSSKLNIIWKSGSNLFQIVILFPVGLWTAGKNNI